MGNLFVNSRIDFLIKFFCVLLIITAVALTAKSQTTKVVSNRKSSILLKTDFACTVNVDGKKVFDLKADSSKSYVTTFGEHTIDATMTGGKEKWSQKIKIESADRQTIEIAFLSKDKFMIYLRSGNVDMMKSIMKKFPEVVNAQSETDWAPLIIALQMNKTPIAKLLLENGADVNSTTEPTPLYTAIMSGNSEIALQLIEKGAAIHFANGDGWTALHAASYQGKEDVVKVLIEKGAVVNLMTNSGDTPLSLANKQGKTSVALLLQANSAKE
jgi:hypothetical protein